MAPSNTAQVIEQYAGPTWSSGTSTSCTPRGVSGLVQTSLLEQLLQLHGIFFAMYKILILERSYTSGYSAQTKANRLPWW